MLDEIGAFGERRQDLRVAKMTMHLVACLRSSSGGAVRLEEMLLHSIDDQPVEPADTAEEVARFDAAAGLR